MRKIYPKVAKSNSEYIYICVYIIIYAIFIQFVCKKFVMNCHRNRQNVKECFAFNANSNRKITQKGHLNY